MPELDYRALRKQVETDLQRQKNLTRWILFIVNLFIYLLFVAISWGMFIAAGGADLTPNIPGVSQSDPITGAMVMMTVAGGLGVMFNFITAMLDTRAGEASMRAKLMGRLVSDEVMRLGEESEGLDEKAKRNLSINDEGELEEVIDEEVMVAEQKQYSSKK
jgi:hypothetical protein